MLIEGQVEGGIAQGIGIALMEEWVPGRTDNLHDYLIPTIGDVPEIETILIEDKEPLGPFGAKGVGEPALIPTAAAILNAIRDATGRRRPTACAPRSWRRVAGRDEGALLSGVEIPSSARIRWLPLPRRERERVGVRGRG